MMFFVLPIHVTRLIQKKIRVPDAEEVLLELTMLARHSMEARAKALSAEKSRQSIASRQSTSNDTVSREARERRRSSKMLIK